MSEGDWQRREPYGDPSPAPGGGGRRRAGGQPAPDPYAPAQDPYARDPYAGSAPGYDQAPSHNPAPGYAQPQQYPPPGYAQPGYAAPAGDPTGGRRRAAPRTGPKVVQSEVINPAAPSYGPRDGYAQGGDQYGQGQYADDGWNTAASPGYSEPDDGYGYDDGRGGQGGGWDDAGDHGGGGDWRDDDYVEGRPPKRGRLRAWAPLFVLLVVLGAFGGCMYGGYAYYKNKLGPAPDYANEACPAADPNKDPIKDQGKVPVEIPDGAIGAKIGQILYANGVVKSVKAYVNAANSNQSSSGIASGTYDVCKGLSGAAAVKELLKASNIEKNTQIDVKSHEWSTEVIASLIQKRHYPQADFDAAIANNTIGLPAWAVVNGKPSVEGLLEPGQYKLGSKDTAQTVLAAMVKRRMDALKAIDFENQAKKQPCGKTACTPEQVLIIASMAEAEVTQASPDGREVAEVVFTRLKGNDFLGIDSTSMYGVQSRTPPKSHAEVADPKNPYSTYDPHRGLPPGPVAIPSIDMIKAVLNPTTDKWYYWCSKNGSTTFYRSSQASQFHTDCKS